MADRNFEIVVRLNDQFRVIAEGGAAPRQWHLQRRKMTRGKELWSSLSFCVTRDGLLLAIREKCIPIGLFKRRFEYPGLDPVAICKLKALPARFQRARAAAEATT